MANVLSDEKKQQVIALGRLRWSLRRIEEETGVRRETASAYLRAAGVAVRPPRGWGRRPPAEPASASTPANDVSTGSGSGDSAGPNPANDPSTGSALEAKPANEVSTGSNDGVRPGRSPIASACEPYRELIEGWLASGRNATAIFQDLVDDHGFGSQYASVKRFVAKMKTSGPSDAHPSIFTPAGEEAQVDYGEGPMVRHPESGKYRRTRLFVLTLGYSRKSVRFLVFKSSSRIWAELHERAFRRLGGAPRVVVLDNLGEGVREPEIYDPILNPLYRDVLKHYGAVGIPARVRDPDRKGKVERGVDHAQRTPLQGLRFETLEEAQAYLDRWEERWADKRIHGTTKRQVAAAFAEEKPSLRPLPPEPFRYYQFGVRTVHLDGHVEVERAYYAPPPGWIGQQVAVQWDGRVVRLLHPKSGVLLVEHLRRPPGGRAIREQDRPKRTPQTTIEVLARAGRIGKHVGAVCDHIHRTDGEPGVRRILGVIQLAKRHGPATVDDACAAALEMGVPTYRFVKRYLQRGSPLRLGLKQVDPLIRQLTEYRDVINRITERRSE
ncbi:MAG TPA: IS21 family transposase [Anaeromyxobacteraceae bacterium]|nr:IS21 family transposase [Anaeromyxobacteraceae bacterium]